MFKEISENFLDFKQTCTSRLLGAGRGQCWQQAGSLLRCGLAEDVAVLIGEHVARIEHADAARRRSNLAELVVVHVFA